jgi:hypothetical protein
MLTVGTLLAVGGMVMDGLEDGVSDTVLLTTGLFVGSKEAAMFVRNEAVGPEVAAVGVTIGRDAGSVVAEVGEVVGRSWRMEGEAVGTRLHPQIYAILNVANMGQ